MDFKKFKTNLTSDEFKKRVQEQEEKMKGVPAGKYEVSVDKMELGVTKDQRPMFKIDCKILNGEYTDKHVFMNRVVYGTKNDAGMIASVLGFLETLGLDLDYEITDYDFVYEELNNFIIDSFEESKQFIYDIKYDPKAFNNISIIDDDDE